MVVVRSDLAGVKLAALKRIVARLSASKLWTKLLSEARWKEGQTQDAIQMYNQWKVTGQFIVVESLLTVEVFMRQMMVPVPRMIGGFFRCKRQAEDDGIDYSIYSLVMNDMKTEFDVR